MPACAVCTANNLDDIEEVGKLCLRGELSWRKGAERAGLKYYQSFKNHMEKHYVSEAQQLAAASEDEVLAELQLQIDDACRDLLLAMRRAPAELKPLYAVAIRNLRGVMETKPSQQHMIAALKAVHEITGMRIEQQTLVAFAQAAFQAPPKVEAIEHSPVRALEAVKDVDELILDVEVVDA